MIRNAHVAAVAIACSVAFLPAVPSAQTADRSLDRYVEAVDAYQAGDLRRAAALVSGWSNRDFDSVVSRALDRNDRRLNETAAVFQTELALLEFDQGLRAGASQLSLAERLVRSGRVGVSSELQERWYALAGSLVLAYGPLDQALLLVLDRGLKLFPESARLHMIAGEADELGAHLRLPAVVEPTGPALTELLWARDKYRHALRLDSQLVEARLRLGRILYLQRQPDEAQAELDVVVRDAKDKRILYLAHLFLGPVHSSKGDLPGALREYESAITVAPEYRTARLALSFAEQMSGREPKAREALAAAVALPEGAAKDPWREYQNGSIDVDSLQWLRERVGR